MLNHTLYPSIEEFAAFLDRNLSQSEMQQFSQLVAHDDALQLLLDANSVVNDTLNGFTDADLQLPSDLVGEDFELPTTSSEDLSSLVSLSSESTDDLFIAACTDYDVAMSPNMNQDDETSIGEDIQDDSSLATLDNDSFDNNDELSGSFSDNI